MIDPISLVIGGVVGYLLAKTNAWDKIKNIKFNQKEMEKQLK